MEKAKSIILVIIAMSAVAIYCLYSEMNKGKESYIKTETSISEAAESNEKASKGIEEAQASIDELSSQLEEIQKQIEEMKK